MAPVAQSSGRTAVFEMLAKTQEKKEIVAVILQHLVHALRPQFGSIISS